MENKKLLQMVRFLIAGYCYCLEQNAEFDNYSKVMTTLQLQLTMFIKDQQHIILGREAVHYSSELWKPGFNKI